MNRLYWLQIPLLFILLLVAAGARRPARQPAVAPPQRLTLKLNGAAVPLDTAFSRVEVSSGAGKVLTLNLIRADAPDDPGLTILVDEFKPVPAVYRFKEILSAHVTEATYRVGEAVAESQACGVNQGEVRVTAVDPKRQIITGTFRAVCCSTNAPRSGKKYTFEGSFHGAYELR